MRTTVTRWLSVVLGSFIAVALFASLVVIPARDVFRQREIIAERRAEFEALADANEQLMKEIDYFESSAGIISAAREQLGYVFPGEKRVALMDPPPLPTALPASWPYSMITNIVAVRSGATAP